MKNYVAELRAKKNAIEAEYKVAQKEALENLFTMMKETKAVMTATEMASISGLSVNEVSSHTHPTHPTHVTASMDKPRRMVKKIARQYAEVNRDGSVNLDNQITVTRRITLYSFGELPY